MAISESPFREQDLTAQVESLASEREALLTNLAEVVAAIARLRPWSWRRFFLGFALVPAAVLLVVLAVVR